jgi:hypothetical protein
MSAALALSIPDILICLPLLLLSDLQLQEYNQTVTFTENIEFMRQSAESTKFWTDLQASKYNALRSLSRSQLC